MRQGYTFIISINYAFLYLISTFALSCTGQLYGLDDTLTTLAQVQVSVKHEEVEQLPPEVQARLRIGVIWLGINIPSVWCAEKLSSLLLNDQEAHEAQPNEDEVKNEESEEIDPQLDFTKLSQLLTLCRNPLGVAPTLSGPSVAIQGKTESGLLNHQLTFTALPPSEVLIGSPDARVAYGVLVVFDDLNENGVLDIGFSIPPLFWDDTRGLDDDQDKENDERAQRRFGDQIAPDELYSASFTSLLSTHQRLVFREGDFVESFFYPMGDCLPPKGFSIATVEGSFPSATCDTYPISTTTVLPISRPSLDRQEVICEPTEVFIFEPPQEQPSEAYEYECISSTELAARDTAQGCKNLSVITLIDCPPSEPNCERPEWNFRDIPPTWWPCTEE
jgi:hypothetical protein